MTVAASNWGLIMNVVNSIVGVSVLTMPFCFKQCGIVLGTLLLFFCSWMTHQSCMFLVYTASSTKRRTYAGLAFHAYGKPGKTLVATSMIGLMLGTCIAFYVVIADLGSNFFAPLLGLPPSPGLPAPSPGLPAPSPGHAAPSPGHAAPSPGHAAPSPSLFKNVQEGVIRFPCAAADGGVSVHRSASQSAEEHDVIYPVLLCHGPHVLHVLHVHVSMVWRQWGLQLLFNLCPPQLPSSDVEDAVGALSLWSSGAGYGKQLHTMVLFSFKRGLLSGLWLSRVSMVCWDGIFRCLPICGMAFACQSQVLPTYDSLDEPSIKRMSTIFTTSLNIVTTFYITVGFFGYVSFTEDIAGNVLMNFPSNLVTKTIRVGFMMSVAVGFPMMILPCRQAINTMLFEQQQKDGTFTAGGYMPPLRFKMITFAIVFGTMLGGILIPNVETILGLTGATMGSLICFICPALIYRKIQKNGLTAQLVLWVGLGILLVSTFTTVSISAIDSTPKHAPPPPAADKNAILRVLPDMADLLNVEKPVVAKQPEVKPVLVERPKAPADVEPVRPVERQQEQAEPPQIKGPEQGVPDRKEEEKVQLDSPDAGVAVPDGEAHRHEPPIPHDEVQIEKRKNDAELEEENQPTAGGEDSEGQGVADQEEVNNKEGGEEEKLPLLVKKEDVGGAEVQSNEVLEKPDPGAGKKQEVPPLKQVEKLALVKEVLVGKDVMAEQALVDAAKAPEAAGKREPAAPVAEAVVPVAAEGAAVPEVKERGAEDKMDVIKKLVAEGQLEHAALLQVIKEQQEQQKRLLDQQEKLLAVIKEQHQEMHPKKTDGAPEADAEKGVQEEGGASKPKGPAQGGPALASDTMEPAGAPQPGGAEPHIQPQNEVLPVEKSAEEQVFKVVAPVITKEGVLQEVPKRPVLAEAAIVAGAAVEAPKERDLVARGVPLGQKVTGGMKVEPAQPPPAKAEDGVVKGGVEVVDKAKERMERLEEVRIDRAVQGRVEEERLERERREKRSREQEIEKSRVEEEGIENERLEKERAERERAERERIQWEKTEREVMERAEKEKKVQEQEEKLAQLESAIKAQEEQALAAGLGEPGLGEELGAVKKSGWDLKERATVQSDSSDVVEEKTHKGQDQGVQKKARDQGDMDLRRRRRALGVGEAGGSRRGVPGLEPFLDGGWDLHAALEGPLLGGALVHTRQIKQTSELEKDE
ncbi:putative sodium-coupled neutral amino acid transporter 10 isoform X3 [Salmo salar]|uniref:Sodium-coupled neutral amino acid transporter 10 isoform X3 n=1 Tax=Salmo salar TaxID=8030 RepID=A0A1S3SLN2_SALSA|nr:putative sodium-coupled neutral amino acid transporter 10 isoform X3 [Salmo salar]|eukprot:XP_014065245.1 PREDICTED: putative sodium-coupled neutral amino acid transporter 10 isoform X3 [Salmo salar]